MAVSLDKKIIDYKVKPVEGVVETTQLMEREEILTGATYKIKPPTSDHAIYITINNDATGRPYEIFLNCKDSEIHAWLLTTTRLISALLRVSHNPQFVAEELKQIIDPKGGYFYPKKGRIESISAHIGLILEQHINTYGRD